jgi:hypothetical protein
MSERDNRDDFPEAIKRTVSARTGNRCSKPDCRALTSGPQVDESKALNVGVAAHISAAAPGGARYDPSLSAQERSDISNAIWLCQTHAKLVDNDPERFPREIILDWKQSAEHKALAEIGRTVERQPNGEPNLVGTMATSLRPTETETHVFLSVTVWNRGSSPSIVKNWQLDAACGDKKLLILNVPFYPIGDAEIASARAGLIEESNAKSGIPPGGEGRYRLRYTLAFSAQDLKENELRLELAFFDVMDRPSIIRNL